MINPLRQSSRFAREARRVSEASNLLMYLYSHIRIIRIRSVLFVSYLFDLTNKDLLVLMNIKD